MAVRDGGDQALADRRAPVEAGQLGVGRRLVEEDEGDYQDFRVWPERLNIFRPSLA